MNRSNAEYKRKKKEYLASKELWGGWYRCEDCGVATQEPQLDHIKRTGMGGSPQLLLDQDNWQLLCWLCHTKKDGGMRVLDNE